ncbi:MAG: histidine phosphatase family protein [Actinomycetota bacterium]
MPRRSVQQARALAHLLRRFVVRRIVSADYVRCTQTVEPLSRSLGILVVEEPLLSEVGYPGREEDALELLRRHQEPGGAVVACSQGDVIPDLLSRLAALDRVPPRDEFVAYKGSVWVLCFSAAGYVRSSTSLRRTSGGERGRSPWGRERPRRRGERFGRSPPRADFVAPAVDQHEARGRAEGGFRDPRRIGVSRPGPRPLSGSGLCAALRWPPPYGRALRAS